MKEETIKENYLYEGTEMSYLVCQIKIVKEMNSVSTSVRTDSNIGVNYILLCTRNLDNCVLGY